MEKANWPLITPVDYATNLPVFGQAMHALPPLRPRFPLPPSSFLVGLVVVLVTVGLVMSTVTITLWTSLVASTMASLMTSLVTTLMTSLSAPLEPSRTSPSLQVESLHSIL